jgi:hypothetical protein
LYNQNPAGSLTPAHSLNLASKRSARYRDSGARSEGVGNEANSGEETRKCPPKPPTRDATNSTEFNIWLWWFYALKLELKRDQYWIQKIPVIFSAD